MEQVIRNVRDIEVVARETLEKLLGHRLRENQQIVIRIVNLERSAPAAGEAPRQDGTAGAALPEWCNVYDGLTEEEVAELEKVILTRADLSRFAE